MVTCELCERRFNGWRELSLHLYFSHNNYNKELYYNRFIGKTSPLCYCGQKKDFRGFGRGYLKYCSKECYSASDENRRLRSKLASGKVQSEKTIEKRIKNTDQNKKEKKRKETCMALYGVPNAALLPRVRKLISKANKGRKAPRTSIHQQKIIASKKKNGTLGHTEKTKRKISKSLLAVYASDDPPVPVSCGTPNGYVTGYYNGIYYRSSYELKFLKYCMKNKIKVISAENKKFRVKYKAAEKVKMYYPDFYLPDYHMVIEIKPLSMYDYKLNMEKFHEAAMVYDFSVITEEELGDLDEFFRYL